MDIYNGRSFMGSPDIVAGSDLSVLDNKIAEYSIFQNPEFYERSRADMHPEALSGEVAAGLQKYKLLKDMSEFIQQLQKGFGRVLDIMNLNSNDAELMKELDSSNTLGDVLRIQARVKDIIAQAYEWKMRKNIHADLKAIGILFMNALNAYEEQKSARKSAEISEEARTILARLLLEPDEYIARFATGTMPDTEENETSIAA